VVPKDGSDLLEERLAEVAREAWKEGCPVAQPPYEELAQVARRRWHSFDRRNKRKHPRFEDRVEDLAKGLGNTFGGFHPNPALVGSLIEDYRYLARRLGEVLDAQSEARR
jgi:hypothetical protein